MAVSKDASAQPSAPGSGFTLAAYFSIMVGPFISMLDGNIINVAVPDISHDLHTTLSAVSWTISAYLLALAAGLPASAWLVRRYGTRRVYLLTLAAFGVASAGCALSTNVETLIAFRALQGFVGAPLVPVALSMLFKGETRYQMPAAIGLMLFLAPALGPSAGGLIIGAAGWRPIFLINVPIVALGMVGALRLPADDSSGRSTAAFDVLGLALLVAGMVLLTYGAVDLTSSGVHSLTGWPSIAVGAVLIAGYALHAHRSANPILDLELLTRLSAQVGLLCCTIASVVLWAMLFVIPVYVQQTMGLSATAAGLILLPQGIVMGAATPLGEVMLRTGRLRLTVTLGMIVLGATTAALFVVVPSTPSWLLALILAGRGVALALTIQPLVAGLLGDGANASMTDSSTVFTMSQRIGASLGIAAVAAFYQARVSGGHAFGDTITLLVLLGAAGAVFALLLPGRVQAPRASGAAAEVTM